MNNLHGHAEPVEAWAMRHGYTPKAQQFDFAAGLELDLDAGRAPEHFRLTPPADKPERGSGDWQERRAARVREIEARREAREGVAT